MPGRTLLALALSSALVAVAFASKDSLPGTFGIQSDAKPLAARADHAISEQTAIAFADEPEAVPQRGVKAIDKANPADAGRAEKLIRQFANAVKSAKTLKVDTKTDTHVQVPGFDEMSSTKGSLAAERPNRLSIRGEEDGQGIDVMSDGKTVVAYVPVLKRYMEHDAPKTLAELTQQPPVVMAISMGGSTFALALLTDDPYANIMGGVTGTEYLGKEELDGKSYHHVKLMQEEADWQAWFTTDEPPLIHRLSVDMSSALARVARDRGVQPEGDAPKMSMILTQEFLNWKLNEKLDDELFAFVAPEGVEKVDNLLGGMDNELEELSPLLGKAAPPAELELLEGGGSMKLADHIGKDVVMLDFWATQCGECVASMPTMSEIAKEYQPKGVILYSINVGEEPDLIREFLKAEQLDAKVALDKRGEVAGSYQVEGIPTLVIIDKKGTVQSVHSGFGPSSGQLLRQELDDVLAGKNLAEQKIKEHEEKRKELEKAKQDSKTSPDDSEKAPEKQDGSKEAGVLDE